MANKYGMQEKKRSLQLCMAAFAVVIISSNTTAQDTTSVILPDHPARPQFSSPAYYWHPAISPSGMSFYTADLFLDWKNNLLLGGLSSESLFRLTLEGNVIKSEERIFLHKRIRDVIQAPDGSVWLLTDYKEGELLRVRPM